ncbi:hypothetical protein BJX65DRAFT_306695 [Aspergillus insuetus]
MALTVGDYVVAWVCALPLEMAAAKAILDETHSPLRHQPTTDHNSYTLGRRALGVRLLGSLYELRGCRPSIFEYSTNPRLSSVNPAEAKRKVKAYLEQDEANRWLLIFDNADSMDMWVQGSSADNSLSLTDYLPLKGRGHILFTTRNRKVAAHLASSNVVHISEPDTEGAVQILGKSLIEKDLLNDFNTTMTLLKQVAFLPLAIIQAAAYINKNLIGLSDYIKLLQEQEADVIELLSEDFGDEGRYKDLQNPVTTTWLMSFQQIQKLDQLAADYLSFMACIHPREIPLSLLPEASSMVKRTKAPGLLKAFSSISEQAGYFNLHRLVHLSTRNWPRSQQQFGRQVSITAMRFAAVFPDHDDSNRKPWRDYLPRILPLLRERDFDWEQHTELIEGVGLCLGMDERYNEAIFFFKKLLRTQKQTHGDTNDKTLSCMADLAWAYRGLGRWIEAEELEIRVLETRKQILGPEHYKTLFAMTNLAFTWSKLGKWQDAEAVREQVLEIKKREIGPEHPSTLDSMSDLARSYSKLVWNTSEL